MSNTRIAVIDMDGSTLARVEPHRVDIVAPGFVPATGNRVIHPELAARIRDEARKASVSAALWADINTMSEPPGIRSDDRRI